MSSMKVAFSFLTAGPRFEVELPSDFEVLPDLSSPLTINNGYAARSFDFVPAAWDTGITDNVRLIRTTTDGDGRTVEVFQRDEEPAQWYLRWQLANGALYTHLREEDGVEKAQIVVASLGIVEDGTQAPPFLLPEAPLGHGASARPGYQETVSYRSKTREGWAVILQRPSFLSKGQLLQVPERRAVFRAGADSGVEVTVLADREEAEGRSLIASAIASFSQAA